VRASFDDVDLERLRRRRTVKWSLYGPDVLARGSQRWTSTSRALLEQIVTAMATAVSG
jgi:hypothetical protein